MMLNGGFVYMPLKTLWAELVKVLTCAFFGTAQII